MIIYSICECYVWTVSASHIIRQCGRCRVVPERLNYFIDKEEALEIFHERYGHYPEPIQKEQFR
jgi:hypothetical protein